MHFCIVSGVGVFVVNTDSDASGACEVCLRQDCMMIKIGDADSPLVLLLEVLLGSRGMLVAP